LEDIFMANVSRPWGLRPSRYWDGSAWNVQAQTYAFSASQANDAYVGDLVQFDSTNRTAALADPFMPALPFVQPVVAGLTTNTFRGVVVGFYPEPEFNMTTTASLGLQFRKASTLRYGVVAEDVSIIFEAEETGNSYTSTSNNGIGKTADISYTAGSQVTGISAVTLTGFQTAAVRPLMALRYTERIDNFNFTASDANSRAHFDVMIVNSDIAKNGSQGS
jgi:hypothetical protein